MNKETTFISLPDLHELPSDELFTDILPIIDFNNETFPVLLESNQRVTVKVDDIRSFIETIDFLVAPENRVTDKQFISLNELKNSLATKKLNLESRIEVVEPRTFDVNAATWIEDPNIESEVLIIPSADKLGISDIIVKSAPLAAVELDKISPENLPYTITTKQLNKSENITNVFELPENFCGFSKLTINDLSIQEEFNSTILPNNLIDNVVTYDFTRDSSNNLSYFGAATGKFTIPLVDAEITLNSTNKDGEFLPQNDSVGFKKVTITPKLDVISSEIFSEKILNDTKKTGAKIYYPSDIFENSDAIGFSCIQVPALSAFTQTVNYDLKWNTVREIIKSSAPAEEKIISPIDKDQPWASVSLATIPVIKSDFEINSLTNTDGNQEILSFKDVSQTGVLDEITIKVNPIKVGNFNNQNTSFNLSDLYYSNNWPSTKDVLTYEFTPNGTTNIYNKNTNALVKSTTWSNDTSIAALNNIKITLPAPADVEISKAAIIQYIANQKNYRTIKINNHAAEIITSKTNEVTNIDTFPTESILRRVEIQLPTSKGLTLSSTDLVQSINDPDITSVTLTGNRLSDDNDIATDLLTGVQVNLPKTRTVQVTQLHNLDNLILNNTYGSNTLIVNQKGVSFFNSNTNKTTTIISHEQPDTLITEAKILLPQIQPDITVNGTEYVIVQIAKNAYSSNFKISWKNCSATQVSSGFFGDTSSIYRTYLVNISNKTNPSITCTLDFADKHNFTRGMSITLVNPITGSTIDSYATSQENMGAGNMWPGDSVALEFASGRCGRLSYSTYEQILNVNLASLKVFKIACFL